MKTNLKYIETKGLEVIAAKVVKRKKIIGGFEFEVDEHVEDYVATSFETSRKELQLKLEELGIMPLAIYPEKWRIPASSSSGPS